MTSHNEREFAQMLALQLVTKCPDNPCYSLWNDIWQPNGPSIEPRTHRDLTSQGSYRHPTGNYLLPGGRIAISQFLLCFRANISSFMSSFQPGIDRTSDTNLRIEYEFKKEIKILKEGDKCE